MQVSQYCALISTMQVMKITIYFGTYLFNPDIDQAGTFFFVQEQFDQTHKLETPLWPLAWYIGHTYKGKPKGNFYGYKCNLCVIWQIQRDRNGNVVHFTQSRRVWDLSSSLSTQHNKLCRWDCYQPDKSFREGTALRQLQSHRWSVIQYFMLLCKHKGP